jgi:hypothetical protein
MSMFTSGHSSRSTLTDGQPQDRHIIPSQRASALSLIPGWVGRSRSAVPRRRNTSDRHDSVLALWHHILLDSP